MTNLYDEVLMNLYGETLEILQEHGATEKDVIWCGSKDGKFGMSWEEFAAIAKNTNYDDGAGVEEIAKDLVVVTANGWFERNGWRDGFEWWEYKEYPQISPCPKKFTSVGRREGDMADEEYPKAQP